VTDTTPLGLIVVRLKVPVKNMPVGTELGYKDVPDAIAALGSAAFFDVVRDQQGNPIPPLTPEEIEEAQRAAQRRAKSRRLILGADFDPLWNRVDGIPSAEELEQMRDDVDAVADVPPRVEAVEQTVATVAPKAERADSRVFDVRAYPSLQAAIDAAHAAGGGEVFVAEPPPDGVDIVLKDKVYLVGRGVGATSFRARTITGSGSLTALPALAANVARHARTVTFASAPSLAPGDVIILHDSADSSFSTARTYYRAGEFCRVDQVAGNVVTLTRPTYAAYASGGTVSASKVNPIRTGISGMTIRGTTGQYLIRVDLGTELVFRDLSLSGSNYSHLALSRCYNVDIANVTAFDAQDATVPGINYGLSLMNCQRVRVRGIDVETRRHGLTLTGDNAAAGVPNRDIRVSDSTISGMSSVLGVTGCNMHGNCEDVHFSNVTMPAGFNPAGDRVTVRGCEISAAAWGTAISSMELLGCDLTFEGNTIRATANHDSQRGLVFVEMGESCTRGNGRLRFINNHLDLGPYVSTGTSVMAIYVLVNSDNVPATNLLEVRDNLFTSDSVTGNHWGVRARKNTGVTSVGFSRYLAINNISDMQIAAQGLSPTLMHFVGHGSGAPSFLAGPGSLYRRTDGGAGTSLYINESGGTNWRAVAEPAP